MIQGSPDLIKLVDMIIGMKGRPIPGIDAEAIDSLYICVLKKLAKEIRKSISRRPEPGVPGGSRS